jgi:SPP1 gp7 family putative phage head morphogenesis protein
MLEPINSQWIENIEGGKYCLGLDTSVVEALRKDYKDKVLIADTMITKHGVPAAKAYELLDIPLDTKQMPWLEMPYVIGSRVNLADGSIVGQPVLPDLMGGDEDEEEEGEGEDPNAPKGEEGKSFIIKATERDKFWLSWLKKTFTPGEKRMQSSLVRYLLSQRNSMLDLVDEWEQKDGEVKDFTLALRALNPSDFTLSLVDENGKLKKIVVPIYDDAIAVQAGHMEMELGGELINWKQNSPYVEKYKKQRLKYIQTINTYTFELASKQIGKAISESITNNLSTKEAANLIKDSIVNTYNVRVGNSLVIARTEMGSIASTTRFSIMHKEGIEKHEWLSARDEKVREDHEDEDGNVVVIGEAFPETGLIHPCEIGGESHQVINCRCTAIPVKS